jgi:hypothetical protein
MTIRLENLTIDHDDRSWVFDCVRHDGASDVTLDETYRLDMLSVVRHILRERHDCKIIPVIVGAVRFPVTNRYGHNGEVEVIYDDFGHRAIYGVHFGERVTNVQCYMD